MRASHFFVVVFLTAFSVVGTNALYEDQVGKFDWHQKYFGHVTFVLNDVNQPKRVLIGSRNNVIGAINSNTGAILYRHVFEASGELKYMGIVGKTLVTVSSQGALLKVRIFEPSSGVIRDEYAVSSEEVDYITEYKGKLYFMKLTGSTAKVSSQDVNVEDKRDLKDPQQLLEKSLGAEGIKVCRVSSQYFICASGNTLSILNVVDGSLSRRPLEGSDNGLDIISSGAGEFSAVGVVSESSTKLYRIIENQKNGPELVPIVTLSASVGQASLSQGELDGEQVLFVLKLTSAQEVKVAIYNLKLSQIEGKELTVKSATPLTALEASKGFCVSSRCGIVGFTPDELLFGSKIDSQSNVPLTNMKVEWTRHEALGSVIAADMVDYPSESGPSWNPYGAQQNVLSAFIARIKYEVEAIVYRESLYSSALDRFGLRKVIVLVTSVGKVFGMDSATGSILYSFLLPEFSLLKDGSVLLYVQRPAKFAPLKPLASVLYRSSNRLADTTILYPFNPVDGTPMDRPQTYPPLVQCQLLLHGSEETNFLKPILMLDGNMIVHSYPASVPTIEKTFFFVVNSKGTPILRGYGITSNQASKKASLLWELGLSNTEILGVYGKHPTEKVHSQGRVLPDRSVSYKYMNPNLVVVVTADNDQGNINVYFVDAVSGSMIHSFWHKKCKGPVHVVHSEHWVVYSLFNEKSRRYEVNSVELYEGQVQNNATAFSSFAIPPVKPIIVKQSYIFPTGIQYMTHTGTEKGITNKDVLIGLPSGGVLELPRLILQPRLSQQHYLQPMHDEDGVIISMPYVPELPVPAEMIINYNQSVKRIQGIWTWPTRLESTCLVLVHGLDLYYTRVTPSKAFDVLKDDFDHWLITVVLLGLIAGAYITKRFSARKQLEQAWR